MLTASVERLHLAQWQNADLLLVTVGAPGWKEVVVLKTYGGKGSSVDGNFFLGVSKGYTKPVLGYIGRG